MGCQRTIAKQIVKQDGVYVLAVKGNQCHLTAAIWDFFEFALQDNSHQLKHLFTEEIDKGHDRVEHRRYWITETLTSIQDLTSKSANLQSVGIVESERHIGIR